MSDYRSRCGRPGERAEDDSSGEVQSLIPVLFKGPQTIVGFYFFNMC